MMQNPAQRLPANANQEIFLQLQQLANAPSFREPYPHVVAADMLPKAAMAALNRDFPPIDRSGYLPLSMLSRRGSFDTLLKELEGPELAAILSDKLGIELRDKPRLITIRKWSAAKDGRIHNDGEAKIATALLYLNETWPEGHDGRLRVLKSEHSFDDFAAEISPAYGSFFAFRRTENSWHGHKPFAGERRVVQVTWLRSWEDHARKEKRGFVSYLFKRLLPARYKY